MTLYPLKFDKITKPKIWGEEIWTLTGFGNEVSVISNGYLAGNSITELIEVYMDELLGQHVYDQYGNVLPLLFKIITANEDLSIQVHPNDEQASPLHSLGKDEMWYVTKATTDASLLLGMSKKVSPAEFKQHIQDNTISDILNKVQVSTGDVAVIPSGLVHSICHGTQVIEIQEASDITYRIYDYNRQGENGQQRQLHIKEALPIIKYERHVQPLLLYDSKPNDVTPLAQTQHFVTSLLDINKPVMRDYMRIDSFVVYICTNDNVTIETTGNEAVTMKAGETVLIPASTGEVILRPQGQEAQILEVYVP